MNCHETKQVTLMRVCKQNTLQLYHSWIKIYITENRTSRNDKEYVITPMVVGVVRGD